MKKEYINYLLYAVIIIAAYFLIYKKFFSPANQAREFLHTLGFGVADRMTDGEAIDAATYIRDFTQRGRKPLPGSDFDARVSAISKKYQIF